MSIQAIAWVFNQDISPSAMKFVLVALADNANAEGCAWPCVKTICAKTGQDRKTVIRAIKQLEASGWIKDTKERKGATKQVKVYQIIPKTVTVPKAELFPISPIEQSRISPETVPHKGHVTVRESSLEPSEYILRKVNEDMGIFDIADDDVELATAINLFANSRQERKKKLTKTACDLLVKKIITLGQPAATAALRESAEKGWASIYPPKEDRKVSMSIRSPEPNGMLSGAKRMELQRQRAQ